MRVVALLLLSGGLLAARETRLDTKTSRSSDHQRKHDGHPIPDGRREFSTLSVRPL